MPQKTFAASDGLTLAYRIDDFTDPWKPAKPLIMLHAAMGRGARFYGWVPHLARHYRVIRLDLRGHGASQIPAPDKPLTMDRLVGDVCDLMDHLGLARAHVIGNSAGGYIAQNLAMGFPERAESIMLFGSTPGLRNSQAASWLPRVAKEGIRGFLTATITDRFIPGVTDPGLVNWFIDECSRNDAAYVSRFIGLMASLDWSDRVHLIRCPTLVVMPGGETVGSTRNYDVMRDKIPDVEMVTYDGMPHNICDALPDRCAADVLRFLTKRFKDGAGPT